MKKIYKYTILLMTLLVINTAVKAIGNDDCSTATSLGTLPAPAACTGTTVMVGASVTTLGTNVGSTPEAIYPYLSHCPINTALPPNDVWYSFVASSYQAVVSISGSTMTTPVITVWTGTCGTLTGMGCVTGSGGAATITIYQTVPGQTYYIQVAGSTAAQVGTFTLSVHNDHDCAQCLTSSSISATPPPTNGAYAPGTRVTFCLTVSHYTQIVQNWLHGVQPTFGAGWDMSTLTPGTPPASVDHAGSWAYYPSGIVSTATGTAWPAGFYYNSTNPHNLVGGPGNSYGDNCPSGNCTWTFCFSITTNGACSPGSDLGVTIRTSADGESGTWTSPGCASDPVASISAIGSCCPPIVSSSPDTCGNGLGKATATAIGANGPWTYHWSAGTPAIQVSNGPSTVYGLTAGTVTVTVTDRYNCTSTANITIVQTSFAGPNQAASCVTSLPGGSVTMGALSTGTWSTMSGNPGTATIANTTDPHTIISNFTAAGTYSFLFSRAGGCTDTAQVSVTVKPNAGGNRVAGCLTGYPGGAVAMGASTLAGASWTPLASNPGTATITTPTSPTTTITNFSAAGLYSFIWTNPSGCADTATVTVTTKPNAGPDQVQNCVTLPGAPATLAATAVAGGMWTALPSNPAIATIATPSSPNTSVSGFTTGGVYNFVWTDPSSGCKDTAAAVINPLPVAPPAVASAGTICVGSSTNLTATSAGNNILWYTTASGGAPFATVASGTSVTVSPATTTTYYAEAQSIGGGTYTLTYNYTGAAQSWTVPAGATTATVYIWSGGGGGGNAATATGGTAGGGGGGGACGITTLAGLTGGNTYSINIGAGGASGSGAGGASSFSGALGTWTVNGGVGGNPAVNGAGGAGTGGAGASTGSGAGLTIHTGGNGSNGNTSGDIVGAGGGGGGSTGNGANGAATCTGVAAAGGSGTYTGGNGNYNPNCGTGSGADGTAGAAPGGGGSGANQNSTTHIGGVGGAGRMIIIYTIPTCTSPSRTPVTVTVVPVPAVVTVAGSGTFCGSAVLTASGGGGNTIYWQNTTSNGVSTATPSTSQTVSTSGTYYFNAYNGTCFGPQGSATVTINTAPAAPTATATPSVICVGASSALVGTSAGNSINWYTVATGGTSLTTTVSGATYTVAPVSTTTYYAEAITSAVGGTATYTVAGSQTWTVPAGVTSATVYIWGAGGGGGAGRSNNNVSGGGGGGGAAGYVALAGLTPGNVYTINVGAGGGGGSGSSGATAGSGGASSITGALGTWTVNGGTGGTDNNGGTSGTGGAGASTGSGTGLAINNGGNGSSGSTATNTGQGGGGGGSTGAGANGSTACPGAAAAGGSGTYTGGTGGYNPNCGSTSSLVGVNGSAAGGGGSGAYRGTSSGQNGGNGGDGQVIIVYNVVTCPSTRTPVTVTVNPVPTATTVSGAGTFCNSAILTASGGTGGTIYWQNTTNGGASTATPSSSQTVTTSGTYYFNSYNGGCWGPQGSATVVINAGPAAPTATATPATICAGATSGLVGTAAGDTIKWYTAATGGSPLTTLLSGATYTVTPAATTTYYAEAVPPNTSTARSDTFFANGSWIVPTGVTTATMYLWGGGGGGGAATTNPSNVRFYVNGGGGGGGALSTNTAVAVTAGQTYTVTIGTGGAGGATAGTAPGAGGTTTVVNGGTTYSAGGGAAGTNQGSNATSATAAGGAGGNTGTGTVKNGGTGSAGNNGNSSGSGVSGTGGGAGGSSTAGTSPASACGVSGTGGTGTYPGGNGGYNSRCASNTDQAGSNGSAPGGGGSGNNTWTARTAGGAGGAGMVIMVYSIVSTPCPSPRTPVTVTVNNIPTPVTVTGGGASCTSTILSATGGTGGTIYWQNATTNGTSAATPSTNQYITTTGTYYFRANNACGWGTQGSAVVTINAKPNAGVDKTACQGGSATMAATAVAGGTWSATAGNPGTATITTATLAGTTITAFSAAGTYNFIWTSGAGCTDTAAVTVNPLPAATVADNATLCVGGSLTATATPTVAGTYTYSWSGPSAYSASGASFTIATTTLANNGNYTLTITNTATTCSATIVTNMAVINCLSVNGSVFDDANGNGIIDGADAATIHGYPMYAILADTTGTVVSVSSIASNGSFSLSNVLPNTAGYSIRVNSSSPAIGSLAPGYAWPANWVGTKAQYGTNNLEGTGIYPGSELVHIAIANTNVTNLLIGYDILPTATTQTYTIPYPHANTTKAVTVANGMGLLAGSDAEDGAFTTGSTFTITSVAALNGNQLFYDANGDGILQPYEQITGYTVITNFDATRLQIHFVGMGSMQLAFSYSTTDAAAQVAPTSAVYTVKWIGTLPVKMIYFTAQQNGNDQSLLKWATASEIDNDHFEIEHSADAQSWDKIGEVKGNGTTSEQHDYSFVDAQPVHGVNYYRLKQVDVDGRFAYSDIAEVEFENTTVSAVTLAIYPNPMNTNGVLNLKLSDASDNIKNINITNAMGQTVHSEGTALVPSYQLFGLNLPSGVYQITINTSNNNTLTQKLVIQ